MYHVYIYIYVLHYTVYIYIYPVMSSGFPVGVQGFSMVSNGFRCVHYIRVYPIESLPCQKQSFPGLEAGTVWPTDMADLRSKMCNRTGITGFLGLLCQNTWFHTSSMAHNYRRCHLKACFCINNVAIAGPRQPRNGQGGQGCALDITSNSAHRSMSHVGNHGEATGCVLWWSKCGWGSLVVCSCELLVDWRLECLRKFE